MRIYGSTDLVPDGVVVSVDSGELSLCPSNPDLSRYRRLLKRSLRQSACVVGGVGLRDLYPSWRRLLHADPGACNAPRIQGQ
jgi:hypothetical protein